MNEESTLVNDDKEVLIVILLANLGALRLHTAQELFNLEVVSVVDSRATVSPLPSERERDKSGFSERET